MMIRMTLRLLPLIVVAAVALLALLVDGPADRAREILRAQALGLGWTLSPVSCPQDAAKTRVSACPPGNSPINPPPAH